MKIQGFKQINRRLLASYLLAFVSLLSCKSNKEETGEHKFTNALAQETSPYLLQHAHNPVDWRPWNEEAFEEARMDDKLILISIGYSSCHWCHVMEEETFEDTEVAELMNANFINIKVDREERPDVDEVYMTAVQLMGGNVGWPLNVIVLPNGKPLYGGTYHTNSEWKQVLANITKLYKEDKAKAAEYANMVAKGVNAINIVSEVDRERKITKELIATAAELSKEKWDKQWGGIIGDQKFMIPGYMMFLLEYTVLTDDPETMAHLKRTLDQMARGGVYDHIGGGFFRYSTDRFWKVPHFEKMLYDNAQIISLYSRAYQVFKDSEYERVVRETIDFLDRKMRNPDGSYYAALDADSEGEEGKYYTWEESELKSVIQDDYGLFAAYFQIDSLNAPKDDRIILTPGTDRRSFVKDNKLGQSLFKGTIEQWKNQLLKKRSERIAPGHDNKIITSWNSLLINGLVDAYITFGEKDYLDKAESIYADLTRNAFINGELVHSFTKGGSQPLGFLEDYSFFTGACLNLYKATLDTRYLETAHRLTNEVIQNFRDEDTSLFRYNKEEELFSKIIKTDDGVLPSPNATVAQNLFIIGHLSGDKNYLERAKTMLFLMQPVMEGNLDSYYEWGSLGLKIAYPYYEIAVVGKDARPKLMELAKLPLVNTLLVGSTVESELPLFKSRYVPGDTYIYVCRDNTCKMPVKNATAALVQLRDFNKQSR